MMAGGHLWFGSSSTSKWKKKKQKKKQTPELDSAYQITPKKTYYMPFHDNYLFKKFILMPHQKVVRVLCYTVRNFECLSIRQRFHHSWLLHNSDTVWVIITKLHNVKQYKTMCGTQL